MTAFDAVILAGGRARRMGGIDKPALEVGGTSLLKRVLSAVTAADLVVVVGPERDLGDVDIVQVQEDPPGGGPVAALATGIRTVTAPVVVVLGADMPSVDGAAVEALVAGLGPDAVHGVVGVDEQGRDQYLCAAYRTQALESRVVQIGELQGASMRSLIDGLMLARLPLGAKAEDIDTPDDLKGR
jgi:molybdopterin-guanine dinucleotide biosynthesis protein A